MRELESSLQEFGEFLLKAQLVRPAAAPYFENSFQTSREIDAISGPLTF